MAFKVVIDQPSLKGGRGSLQRVSTVYIDAEEYSVYAPEGATGDALEWAEHFCVRYGEYGVNDAQQQLIIEVTTRKLKETKRDSDIASGLNPDGRFCNAQICIKGHVHSSDGSPFKRQDHCTKCGAVCIDVCQRCNVPIRGRPAYSAADYDRPSFCHGCGNPYPWMDDKLNTARDLLQNDDQLTSDDRDELCELLKFVMSDPKAELAPAKTTLIRMKLQKAAEPIRDAFLTLLAKYAAEMSKE